MISFYWPGAAPFIVAALYIVVCMYIGSRLFRKTKRA